MKSIYNYIISCDNRYNNSKQIDNKELILNTEVTEKDYHFVNRIGKILSTPLLIKTPAKIGDEVILHHNVFRRWYEYFVSPEEIFAYKNNGDWKCFNEFCFVKPLKDVSKWSVLKEKKLLGELVYSNEYLESLGLSCGDVVGFKPNSEYEFNIENKKLYRVLSNYITYVKNTKNN